MTTSDSSEEDACRAYAERRLAAIPNVSIFHEGGPLSWDIELGFAGQSGASSVSIEGSVKPLPVLGAFVQAFGSSDAQGNVKLKVEVSYDAKPDWVSGDYESWISSWGA